MKPYFLTICLLASLRPAGAAPDPLVLTPALVNQLAEELSTNHPALTAARARTNAAAAGVAAVRTWEDPMATLGVMTAETSMRKDDGDLIYGLEQKLPLFGKTQLARRVARAELEVETANAATQFQTLRSELAKALFRAGAATAVVKIGEEDLAFLQTTIETMDAKFQVGAATRVELLLAQNERAKRGSQLQTDRARMRQARVMVNRLLNRPLEANWPDLSLPPVAAPIEFNERLVSFATRYEPRLLAMRAEVRQAAAVADATRRSRLPEVGVGAQSRNYSGTGEFRQAEFMLNFSLPFFNRSKYRADLQRDEARLESSEAEARNYALTLRAEVRELTVNIDAARREALLYQEDIIPRSESALESARAGWEAGKGSFRDVLDARRMLLEGRLMYARAVAEQYTMLSDLVLCCGVGDLESLQMLTPEAAPKAEDKKP